MNPKHDGRRIAVVERGFTLIELLISIAVIGILSAIVLHGLFFSTSTGEDGRDWCYDKHYYASEGRLGFNPVNEAPQSKPCQPEEYENIENMKICAWAHGREDTALGFDDNAIRTVLLWRLQDSDYKACERVNWPLETYRWKTYEELRAEGRVVGPATSTPPQTLTVFRGEWVLSTTTEEYYEFTERLTH